MPVHQIAADPLVMTAIAQPPTIESVPVTPNPSSATRVIIRPSLPLVRNVIDRPAFRYLCVGGICALINWLVMLLIDDQRYLMSSILCFVPLGTLSFFLHTLLTFRTRPSLRSWLAYLAGLLPGSIVSLGILAMLRDLANWPLFAAMPATVVTMTVFNFLLSRMAIVGFGATRSL